MQPYFSTKSLLISILIISVLLGEGFVIQSLSNENRQIKEQLSQLHTELDTIKDNNAVLSRNIEDLLNVSSELKEENRNLEVENDDIKIEFYLLKAENYVLQNEYTKQRTNGTQLASWIVYLQGNTAYAKNATTGLVEYSGDPADTITYTTSHGGVTYVMEGVYYIKHSITLSNNSGIVGAGQGSQLILSNNANQDMIVILSNSVNCFVSNLYLNGNKWNNNAGSGVTIYGYCWRPLIQHITIRDFPEYGLRTTSLVGDSVYEPIFYNIDVRGCGLDGVNIGFCSDAYGENIYSEGNAGAGIQHYDVAGTWIHEHAVYNYGEFGIIVSEFSTDLRLLESHLDKNQKGGLLLKGKRNCIYGAFVFNSGQSEPGKYDGLVIENATDCIVTGSIITDYQETKTQKRAIIESGFSDYNLIEGNNLVGNLEPSLINGPNDKVRGNLGYITEAGGEVLIQAGTDTVRVSHMSDYTPRPGDIQVIPAGPLSNCTQFWISSVDEKGFNIKLDGLCKESVVFYWSVHRN